MTELLGGRMFLMTVKSASQHSITAVGTLAETDILL